LESDVTFDEVAADVVAVVLIVLMLSALVAVWAWGMGWVLAGTVRAWGRIAHPRPNYRRIRKMEAALFPEEGR
jgi:hypothetical protein